MRLASAPSGDFDALAISAGTATRATSGGLDAGWRYSHTATFSVAFAVYMLFFAGHYVTGDAAQRIAWAKALLNGSNDISDYFPGLHFTKYGIGGSLIHIPFLWTARAITRLTGIHCEGPVNMLLYEINGALGVTIIYSILTERCDLPRRDAFVRSLVIGFSSVWFTYTKVEYAESLAAVALLSTLRFADSRPITAGLLGGFAIALRPDCILWFIPTTIFGTSSRASRIRVFLAAVPWLALVLWSNYARTGAIWNSGYEIDFSTPLLVGLYGLVFSAGKSALIFSPLLILYFSAVKRLWHDPKVKWLLNWSIVLIAGQLCFYGKWWDWSGDDSWGPRLIIFGSLAALLAIGVSDLPRTRWFRVLAGIGLVLQLPPLLIGPHTVILIDHQRPTAQSSDWTQARGPLTLDDVRFNPAYSQVTNTADLLLLKMLPGTGLVRRTRWMAREFPSGRANVPIDVLWLRLVKATD